MEQIKVNMIPNGEVKTIHCSKGDGKTRKWGFELYKEDGIIPSSSISPQMFFDSYKGGTEQILPENGSEPTTSPIIADIQYPDALRSEQEFLYRESPTAQDGQAKTMKIKGNTIPFNQLVQNGNFVDNTTGWWGRSSNFTVSSNIATVTATSQWGEVRQTITTSPSHRYFVSVDVKGTTDNYVEFISVIYLTKNNEWEHFAYIADNNSATSKYFNVGDRRASDWTSFNVRNAMIFDLTAMGLDTLSQAEVEQWFSNYYSLPYYDYTQGKLLPFLGEELKTTGKNLNDGISQGYWINLGANSYGKTENDSGLVIPTLNATAMTISTTETQARFRACAGNAELSLNESTSGANGSNHDGTNTPITINTSGYKFLIVNATDLTKIQVEYGSTATSYEPYIESTTPLIVLDHFPTGMKDVPNYGNGGRIFDELRPNKANTRIGSYTFTGTENFFVEANTRFYVVVTDYIPVKIQVADTSSNKSNALCDKYEVTSQNQIPVNAVRKTAFTKWGDRIYCYFSLDGLSTADDFKQWLSENPVTIYYELETPTETTINTASLVSEQAEIPLYEDDDILIGECTEQLSSESGFVPVKIKYQDDSGVAYSQKINLHVEK